MPSVSRLQKLHNVDITLNSLREESVKLDDVYGGRVQLLHCVTFQLMKTLILETLVRTKVVSTL